MSISLDKYIKSSSPNKFISMDSRANTLKEFPFTYAGNSPADIEIASKLYLTISNPGTAILTSKSKNQETQNEKYWKAPKPKVEFKRIALMSGDEGSPSFSKDGRCECLNMASQEYSLVGQVQPASRSPGRSNDASSNDSADDSFPYIEKKVHPDDYSDLSV